MKDSLKFTWYSKYIIEKVKSKLPWYSLTRLRIIRKAGRDKKFAKRCAILTGYGMSFKNALKIIK